MCIRTTTITFDITKDLCGQFQRNQSSVKSSFKDGSTAKKEDKKSRMVKYLQTDRETGSTGVGVDIDHVNPGIGTVVRDLAIYVSEPRKSMLECNTQDPATLFTGNTEHVTDCSQGCRNSYI